MLSFVQHNADTSISQEFYIWPSVKQAAKNALDIRFVPFSPPCLSPPHYFTPARYRLLDYIYTAFHHAHTDGSPVVLPLWFKYPKDPNTYGIDHQFFFGDSILVSPVTQDEATSVSIYLPKDTFYDFKTLAPVQGNGAYVSLDNVPFTEIPLHIRGGVVLPLRAESAMTTTQVRKEDFELVVAPGWDGKATGKLYVDDGESVSPPCKTEVWMRFGDSPGRLDVGGTFGYELGVEVKRVRFLGVLNKPGKVLVNGEVTAAWEWDGGSKVLDVSVGRAFDSGFVVQYS
jgi:alpha-glucosidase